LGNETGFTFVIISNRKPIRMKTNFFNLFRLILLGIGCTFLFSCEEADILSQYVSTAPIQNIKNEKAIELQKNFHELRLCDPKSGDSMDMANNSWISIESLANYLNNIINNPPAGVTAQDISGIRIYFGRYSEGTTAAAALGNDRMTVFMVPTVNDGNGTDRENDPDLEVDALNYGIAGQPPRKTFPHD
jgi:hypothetical protein